MHIWWVGGNKAIPISDRVELTFGRVRCLSERVPPQPNCPSAAVSRSISNTEAAERCYIVALATSSDMAALLPPTLYSCCYIATADYSKDLWGLLVPLRDSGICTGHKVHRTPARDSRAVVVTFMQVDN